jgi:hypothetical protein
MADRITVNSQKSLSEAIASLSRAYTENKYIVISYRAGRDRTIDQNALWFAMYQRIAQMTQIGDVEDARRYCKLHFGVPIMRRDDAAFRDGWNAILLHLQYEQKLELMGPCALFGPDGFPVTRLFNRKQGAEYTDRIAVVFGEKGVFFDDLLSGNDERKTA